MLVLEFKTYGKTEQFKAIDEAIRICQFIRNKSIRTWLDQDAKSWLDLFKYCAIWAKEFDFANKLNSMARQASAERAWASISRFHDNVKKGVKGKKVGFPGFQKDCRSVEYKTSGGKVSDDCKEKGSMNRRKARVVLGQRHLKISRQRKDHAIKLARCVITSNDVVVYEDLRLSNLVKNHCLAKSISDASWYQFRVFLEYFGKVFGRITIAVNPAYTSQECSNCGEVVKKSLSTRTHACQCGCVMDRDHNAAINILNRGISTTGHVGISLLDNVNA